MVELEFILKFEGYWIEQIKDEIPNKSGIYCVYECTHNIHANNLTLNKLIQIGESDDVNTRIANHEKYEDWMKHVRYGNELCYSFTPIVDAYRERVEAALIFAHKPPANTEYKYSFPFDKTYITTSGLNAWLDRFIEVERTIKY